MQKPVVQVRLHPALVARLAQHVEQTYVDRSTVVTTAIREYLDRFDLSEKARLRGGGR